MSQEISKQTDLSAQEILKTLRLGKKITSIHISAQAAINLRNRVATLKSEEDKLLSLLPIPEDPLSLLSKISQVTMKSDDEDALELWHLTMELGKKKEAAKFQVIIGDDVESNGTAA